MIYELEQHVKQTEYDGGWRGMGRMSQTTLRGCDCNMKDEKAIAGGRE